MRKVWDKIGIGLSTICLIHCVFLALLPLAFPALALVFSSYWVHMGFAALILITSPVAFIPGYKRHGITKVLYVALSGLVCVLAGLGLELTHQESLSHSLTVLGSLSLVYAHYLNIKHSQKSKCCPE